MKAHRCGRLAWNTCSACRGRIHLADCTTKRRPALDCCPERHARLHALGFTRGIDDDAIPMLPERSGADV